ncbi:MAG: HEAT repeat domain-containing protein [Chloroflexota bacterium]|nr:HEAT repeat domain-containing protein [Chloroflexota bacterium]
MDHIRVFTPEEEVDPDEAEVTEEPKPALDEVIAALIAGEYPRSVLVGLSDLGVRDAAELDRAWPQVDVGVRRAVPVELSDLAEERVDYVFHRALVTLLDDPDSAVRQLAIAGLWEGEDLRIASTLASMVRNDESEDVRAEAARGLGKFVERIELGEIEGPVTEEVLGALRDTLEDDSESLHVRARALESMAVLSADETVQAAIDRFYTEDETGYRATAIFAMGRSMNRSFLPTVLNETTSDDPEIRFEAARAAGRLGDTSALPMLAELAADDDAEVRHAAITGLGEIGGTAAVRYLRRLAEDAPEADHELIEDAMEEATVVIDPLLLDEDST